MKRSRALRSLVLLMALGVASCGSPAGVEPVTEDPPPGSEDPPPEAEDPPEDPPSIRTTSDLVPGQTVTLLGQNVDGLTDLTVDGDSVTLTVLDDSTATFEMPVRSACDVDRRLVEILASGGVRHEGELVIEDATRLELGASRMLSANELACLQIAGGDEDYVLAAASHTPDRGTEVLFRLRFDGASQLGAAPSTVSSPSPGWTHGAPTLEPVLTDAHLEAGDAKSSPRGPAAPTGPARTEFAPYSTAEIGDTVALVDWKTFEAQQGLPRDEVSTYDAVVVAASDGQLIVVDPRSVDPAEFLATAVQARFQAAAEMADAFLVPALRAVIDPDFEMPQGAGGRVVTVIREMAAVAQPNTNDLEGYPASSDMFGAYLSHNSVGYSTGDIARLVIHEAAHVADDYYELQGKGVMSDGWFREALAVNVADVAARMAAGPESQAPWKDAFATELGLQSIIANRPSPTSRLHSPWGPPGFGLRASGPGSYDRGARVLRYAIRMFGADGFSTDRTYYQHLSARASFETVEAWTLSWQIEAMAEALGTSVEELLEQSMIADLTDDLLPADVLQQYDIPQVAAWDHSPEGEDERYQVPNLIDRQTFEQTVEVPAGGYAYWYIRGAPVGLSIQAADVDLKEHHQVLLMRLR